MLRAAEMNAVAAIRPGFVKQMNRYRFLECIGRGRFGMVYLGEDHQYGKRVAIKTFEDRDSPVVVNEILSLNKIKEFPNAHKYFSTPLDIVETDHECFVVMEYFEGGDLFDTITSQGKVDEYELKPIFKTVTESLYRLHVGGVIHRDVKPENILFRKLDSEQKSSTLATQTKGAAATGKTFDGLEPVLADFGLSLVVSKPDVINPPAGTFGYAAPEILAGDKTFASCDVWSLGVVLYASLCGRLPFPSTTDGSTSVHEHLDEAFAGPRFSSSSWDNVSIAAKDLIRDMLHYSPYSRISIPDILHHPWMVKH